MRLEPDQYLQIRLGGDTCTCYDIGPFMGFPFVVESHDRTDPCTAEQINITYGSSSDVQTLEDGDYIVRYDNDDVVGYPKADFERVFDYA